MIFSLTSLQLWCLGPLLALCFPKFPSGFLTSNGSAHCYVPVFMEPSKSDFQQDNKRDTVAKGISNYFEVEEINHVD